MEDAEESPAEIQSPNQSTSVTSRNSTRIDECLISPESKRQKKAYLPSDSEKVLRDWLYEHQFNANPSEAERRMLSEQSNLSFLQITNWFKNARRCVFPEMLQQNVNDSKHQIDNDADETQPPNTDSSILVQAGPGDPDKVECLPLSPLPRGQESGKKLPDPEPSPSQKLIIKGPLNEKIEVFTSEPLAFPESVWPEEHEDFSNFYILVNAAEQKAAELQLQKKQQPNPRFLQNK
ncbi:Homeobox protein TGIF2LX [Heterocephalus glaber]|uniref:Homeobox protein TGIF2LX n=1 Tax=Heterocephalus glaber TaxID=10181 RepID=G5ATG0_HETGA|nr:homeobox protein TGIF2LX [Heterocephalus glaber]EHB00321.1 Homeobox protein TGIF2LX [Heterocephalus glaber]